MLVPDQQKARYRRAPVYGSALREVIERIKHDTMLTLLVDLAMAPPHTSFAQAALAMGARH